MDRQLLVALVLTLAGLTGCSKSKSPPPTAAANRAPPAQAASGQAGVGAGANDHRSQFQPQAAADGDSSPTETHRPITRDGEPNTQQWPPASPQPPDQQPSGGYRYRTEIQFPGETVEGNLARPPAMLT